MKKLKTYIGIIKVQEDEFISKRYLVNYINIGTRWEQRMDDLILDRFKLFNPQNNRNEFVSPLNNCIFYTENEVKVLKKYHPDMNKDLTANDKLLKVQNLMLNLML